MATPLTLHTHDLHDHPLFPLSIELRVEHLLPRTEIELPVGDRQHHLVAHDGALQVRIGVVLARLVMLVGEARRRQLLEPYLKIMNQAVFPVVDEHTGSNVHRRDQSHAFPDSALLHNGADFVGDADELLSLLRVEPKVICKNLHLVISSSGYLVIY